MDFVIVGIGRMGKLHIKAAQSLGLRLAGICDRSTDRIQEVAIEYSLPASHCFSRSATMFETVRAPVTLIATTADHHAELVVSAAKHSRYILCEKPMATSLSDSERMIAACNRSNTQLAINHQMRFMERYTRIRDELLEGRLGRLGSMNVVAGNFGLAMNGSHYFEAFRFLTGSKIRSVAASFSPTVFVNPRGPKFRDAAGALLCLAESGQHFLLSAGEGQGHGLTVTYATEWGHIFCNELEGMYLATARKPEHRDLPSTRYGMPWDSWERTFPVDENMQITAAVLKALLAGNDYPTAQDGQHTLACLVAAYKSSENGGRPVSLDDVSDCSSMVFPWA